MTRQEETARTAEILAADRQWRRGQIAAGCDVEIVPDGGYFSPSFGSRIVVVRASDLAEVTR